MDLNILDPKSLMGKTMKTLLIRATKQQVNHILDIVPFVTTLDNCAGSRNLRVSLLYL